MKTITIEYIDELLQLGEIKKLRKIASTELETPIINHLLRLQNQHIFSTLSSNKTLPQYALSYIAVHGKHFVQCRVFKNPTLNNNTIFDLLNFDINFVEFLTNRRGLNEKVLWKIVKDRKKIVNPRRRIDNILKINKETISLDLIFYLFNEFNTNKAEDYEIMKLIATDPKTPSSIIFKLIDHPNDNVKKYVMEHPNFNMKKYLEEFASTV